MSRNYNRKDVNDRYTQLEKYIEHLQSELHKLRSLYEEEKRKKNDALQRLSQIAGNKLKDGNPAIADLSDANRPSKLGEQISSLYTAEWMDAYESLQEDPMMKNKEQEICSLLLNIFVECFNLCAKKSQEQLHELKEMAWNFNACLHLDSPGKPAAGVGITAHSMYSPSPQHTVVPTNFNATVHPSLFQQQNLNRPVKAGTPMPYYNASPVFDEIIQLAKNRRKEDNSHVNEKIKMECLDRVKHTLIRQRRFQEMTMKTLYTYIYKCAELSWKMSVQDPPMEIKVDVKHGTVIDRAFKEYFSLYTKTTKNVDYVVFPAILLHKDGALIHKGVVQGI